jgi:hypothetical protein
MKTTSRFLTIVISVASATSAMSADTGGLEVKNKSSFNAAPGVRNPFWPIGWMKQVKGVAVPVVTKTEQGVNASGFTLMSVFLGNPAIAVINGRDYQEGDKIRVNGAATEVQVVAIRDGEVVLRSGESQVAIRMKRK